MQFFSKSTSSLSDHLGELLKVDMHSHLIPGIDDGSQSLESSMVLVKGLVAMGYQKLITTPHISDIFPNEPDGIENRFNLLKAEVEKQGLPVMLSFAAEYLLTPELAGLADQGQLLHMNDRYVLVETLYTVRSQNFDQMVFELRSRGFEVILAHPERYKYIKSFAEVERFFELGCHLQVNLLSLTGHYGKDIQTMAYQVLDSGLCSFLGTDLHHEGQLRLLVKYEVDSKTRRLLETINFKNNEFVY